MTPTATTPSAHELSLTRTIAAPRRAVFRAWTDPAILKEWFAPRPWSVSEAELDVRPGGSNFIVMRSPEGEDYPNRGVYLEVVENERLVLTDAYSEAWVPSEKPFITIILTFEDVPNDPGRTRYTARVRHWTAEDRETHEGMGFHEGWGRCTDQLEEVAARL